MTGRLPLSEASTVHLLTVHLLKDAFRLPRRPEPVFASFAERKVSNGPSQASKPLKNKRNGPPGEVTELFLKSGQAADRQAASDSAETVHLPLFMAAFPGLLEVFEKAGSAGAG